MVLIYYCQLIWHFPIQKKKNREWRIILRFCENFTLILKELFFFPLIQNRSNSLMLLLILKMIRWTQGSLRLLLLYKTTGYVYLKICWQFCKIMYNLWCHNPKFRNIKLNVKIPWLYYFTLSIKPLLIYHNHNKF